MGNVLVDVISNAFTVIVSLFPPDFLLVFILIQFFSFRVKLWEVDANDFVEYSNFIRIIWQLLFIVCTDFELSAHVASSNETIKILWRTNERNKTKNRKKNNNSLVYEISSFQSLSNGYLINFDVDSHEQAMLFTIQRYFAYHNQVVYSYHRHRYGFAKNQCFLQTICFQQFHMFSVQFFDNFHYLLFVGEIHWKIVKNWNVSFWIEMEKNPIFRWKIQTQIYPSKWL